MAQSRLERIGTVFSRIQSLMKGGAMKPEDRPLWYDVYEAFPPKLEPRFDRVAPNIAVRDIFYKEDVLRAKFQKEHTKFYTNLSNASFKSETQKFLAIYDELEKAGTPESEIYKLATDKWAQQMVQRREERETEKKEDKVNVKLTEIFQEDKKEL